MAKVKQKSSSPSPYVKRDKAPYIYNFKNCSHRNTVNQSVPAPNGRVWTGKICTACNVIVQGPRREE
jgi:hypothetical protein